MKIPYALFFLAVSMGGSETLDNSSEQVGQNNYDRLHIGPEVEFSVPSILLQQLFDVLPPSTKHSPENYIPGQLENNSNFNVNDVIVYLFTWRDTEELLSAIDQLSDNEQISHQEKEICLLLRDVIDYVNDIMYSTRQDLLFLESGFYRTSEAQSSEQESTGPRGMRDYTDAYNNALPTLHLYYRYGLLCKQIVLHLDELNTHDTASENISSYDGLDGSGTEKILNDAINSKKNSSSQFESAWEKLPPNFREITIMTQRELYYNTHNSSMSQRDMLKSFFSQQRLAARSMHARQLLHITNGTYDQDPTDDAVSPI